MRRIQSRKSLRYLNVPVEFFVVRAIEPAADALSVNRFLASRRVLSIDRRFVECGLQSYWSICVDYLDSTIATVGGTQSKRKGIVECSPKTDPDDMKV